MNLVDWNLVGVLSMALLIVIILLIDQIKKLINDGSFENSTPLYELAEQEKKEIINNLKKFYRENQWHRRNGKEGFFRLEEKQFIL